MNYNIPFETIWAGISHKANGHVNESRLEDVFRKAYKKAEKEQLPEAEMVALLNSYGDALENDKTELAEFEAFWGSLQGKINSILGPGREEFKKEPIMALYYKIMRYLDSTKAAEYINLYADSFINETTVISPIAFLLQNGVSEDELGGGTFVG